MFMRFVQIRIDNQYIDQVKLFYQDRVLSGLHQVPGCLFAGLMQSSPFPQDFISLTIFKTKKEAETYEKGILYNELIREIEQYLAEGSEWRIQLSKDLELEYAPVREEPEIKQLSVTAQANREKWSEEQGNNEMHIRIVSVVIADDKIDEFRRLYIKEIIPQLKNTSGCRHVFLTESLQKQNEVLSITVWDSSWYAEKYEKSGQFKTLLDKVSHTMSDLYKYKMALEQKPGRHSVSKDDMTITHYEMVKSKSFDN